MSLTLQPINGLSNGVSHEPGTTPTETTTFWPKPPQTIAEAGLIVPMVEDHLIWLVYFGQQATGAELAAGCGIPYVAIQKLIHGLVRDHVLEIVGQKSLIEAGYWYQLAPNGRARADEALHRTWYRGPLPVPLDKYVEAITAQSIGDLVIRRDALRTAFSDLVISESFLDRIGPAVNAAQSIFLYGAPGNGKTAIAERITAMIGGAIFIPHAIEVDGSIIMLFDELNRFRIPVDDPTMDQFAEVFQAVCKAKKAPFDFESFVWLVDEWWKPYGRPFRMVQPRDLVNQLIAIAKYLGEPPAMKPELLNRACKSYFVIDTTPSNTAAKGV